MILLHLSSAFDIIKALSELQHERRKIKEALGVAGRFWCSGDLYIYNLIGFVLHPAESIGKRVTSLAIKAGAKLDTIAASQVSLKYTVCNVTNAR